MLKKMKKYIAVLLTVTLICSFGLTGCGTNSASNSKEATAENPMVLTLAHGLSESHTVHIAMLQFAEEVKQKTYPTTPRSSAQCAYCGKVFEMVNSKQKFCSHECYIKNRFWSREDAEQFVDALMTGEKINISQWLRDKLKDQL